MTSDTILLLEQQNSALSARIAELTEVLARTEAFARLHGGIVHDLRNAFHVALMAAETLNHSLTDPVGRELATSIATATDHGSALARDLLALARNQAVSTTVVNCADLLVRLRRLIRFFEYERIECQFEIANGVGSVAVARSLLEAVLINLSVNAREAMPNGGRLRISVRNLPPEAVLSAQLSPGDYVEFAVGDTGIGMSSAVLARATEAFFTTKGSSGLGLATAESFATRFGGALTIDSRPEHGTIVRVLLPRAPSPAQ